MKPIAKNREDYVRAYRAFSGTDGELIVEDLELLYMYQQGNFDEVVMQDSVVDGRDLLVWLDGAQSVVRRLKRAMEDPERELRLNEDSNDEETV